MIGACLPERVRQFVRVVSAEPPYDPEPHPDEPFAPVYDYRPLGFGPMLDGWVSSLPAPRYPDQIAFGPPGADPERELASDGRTRWCGCGAGWGGDAARCWNCGRPG